MDDDDYDSDGDQYDSDEDRWDGDNDQPSPAHPQLPHDSSQDAEE